MMKKIFIIGMMLFAAVTNAQNRASQSTASQSTASQSTAKNSREFSVSNWLPFVQTTPPADFLLNSRVSKAKTFVLNIAELEQLLLHNDVIVVNLPLPDGRFVPFQLTSSPIMAKELANKYPSIKTFDGFQLNKPANSGRFDITPHGFHGVFTYQNNKVYIDPIARNNNRQYQSYFRKDALPLSQAALGRRLSPVKRHLASLTPSLTSAKNSKTQQLLSYRIAVATTGEYSNFHGGTKEQTLAAVVTLLNRVNDVYQRDLGIKLELVADNDKILFTDAETDPFNNTDEDIDVSTEVINNAIGIDNYDIGHVVGTGGGGLAGFGVVCSEYKGEGITGSDRPTGDAFHIDYVAHEIGHQFGAEHTFNGFSGACEENRSQDSAYEPGSASTIMGYAGICDDQNLQNNSDPYFHLHSIEQITRYTQEQQGNSCSIKISSANNAPTVNAGEDYVIPARTAFVLTGTANDSDNDVLSYSWEEFDLGERTASQLDDQTDDGKKPLFRVFPPKNAGQRVFPQMATILSGSSNYGEILPTKTRDLNFRLVVRDGKGSVVNDAVKLAIIGNEQGFSIIEPSVGSRWLGTKQMIVWQTANTELAPVLCPRVDILLSTDSGKNFPQTILANTENDGDQEIELPATNSEQARIKISCNNNIFFAINSGDINIITDGVAEPVKPEFSGQQALITNEDQALTLQLTDLHFLNNQLVDTVTLVNGENYQVNGLMVTPSVNFNGELSVLATATKGDLISDQFILKVTVVSVNDIPQAENDVISVKQGSASNSIAVLANDSDIDNDNLLLTTVDYSGSGSVVIKNNQLIYTPASGFSGKETLTYIVSDGNGGEASASVTITVIAKAAPVEPKKSSGGTMIYLLMFVFLASKRVMTRK
ncbi:MAG: hypothetical protein COB35_04435 [Gammaproteobacteria bacterium]|nr:MAG: hypothetical protein COB35_04435 [Gammaproteobacteria bacterium]